MCKCKCNCDDKLKELLRQKRSELINAACRVQETLRSLAKGWRSSFTGEWHDAETFIHEHTSSTEIPCEICYKQTKRKQEIEAAEKKLLRLSTTLDFVKELLGENE